MKNVKLIDILSEYNSGLSKEERDLLNPKKVYRTIDDLDRLGRPVHFLKIKRREKRQRT